MVLKGSDLPELLSVPTWQILGYNYNSKEFGHKFLFKLMKCTIKNGTLSNMYLIVGKYISECPITCCSYICTFKEKKVTLNIYRIIGRNPPPGLVYADSKTYSGPDEDISFDHDDELVFMARHLGTRKAKQDKFIFNENLGNDFQAKLR